MTAYSEDTKGRWHITESAFCSSASALCHCVSYLVLFVTSNIYIYYLGEWTHISCVFIVWERSTPEQLSRELPVWIVKRCRSECCAPAWLCLMLADVSVRRARDCCGTFSVPVWQFRSSHSLCGSLPGGFFYTGGEPDVWAVWFWGIRCAQHRDGWNCRARHCIHTHMRSWLMCWLLLWPNLILTGHKKAGSASECFLQHRSQPQHRGWYKRRASLLEPLLRGFGNRGDALARSPPSRRSIWGPSFRRERLRERGPRFRRASEGCPPCNWGCFHLGTLRKSMLESRCPIRFGPHRFPVNARCSVRPKGLRPGSDSIRTQKIVFDLFLPLFRFRGS